MVSGKSLDLGAAADSLWSFGELAIQRHVSREGANRCETGEGKKQEKVWGTAQDKGERACKGVSCGKESLAHASKGEERGWGGDFPGRKAPCERRKKRTLREESSG